MPRRRPRPKAVPPRSRRYPVASQPEHRLALGLHQALEYVLAIAIAIAAVHISGRAELTLLAGAVILAGLAALTKGPLAAFRVVPARVHRILEVTFGAVLVLLPLASLRHPSAVGIGLLELAGLVLLRLAYVGIRPARTPKQARVRVPVAPSRVAPVRPDQILMSPPPTVTGVMVSAMEDQPTAVSGVVFPEAASSPDPDVAESKASSVLGASARAAGRLTGKAKRKVGEAAPVADEMLGRGARRLGAAVGRRSARKGSG